MGNLIVNENDVGYVKLYADDFKNYSDFKQYWDTPNVESFEDDQVLMFRTFDLERVKKTVWILEQYDIWFSSSTDSWSKDYYENGTDQWMSDTLDCGIMIREVSLDKFGEL